MSLPPSTLLFAGNRPGSDGGVTRSLAKAALAAWLACLAPARGAEPAPARSQPGVRWQPLVVAESGRTGFVSVPPATTGIRFENPLPDALACANNNLMNGSGVAAGDFDGDGRCDLYFCAIAGTNALYRNLGDWRFEDVTARAGVGLPGLHSTGAVFADTDGDGQVELLVATLGSGVHCFANRGGGRFEDVTAAAGLATPSGSTSLALADLDGDGDLDLYVANYGDLSILRSGGRAEMKLVDGQWTVSGPHAKRLRFVDGRLEEVGEPDALYLNDGRGHFALVPWSAGAFLDEQGQPRPEPWDFGLSVQLRDINADGFPDIYVCNDFQSVDRLWLNDGTAHFRAVPRPALRKQSFSSMGVDFADLDGDGWLDFFVTEMMSRSHGLRARQVVGMAPLVPVPGRIENRPEVARNTLFHNRGDGTYEELANYAGVAATDWSWQPLFLDVDLDGYDDILIGNGMMRDVQDRDALARVRSFGRQAPEQARTNLLLYPAFLSPNYAFRNQHDLTFAEVGQAWGFDSTRITQGMALADLDGDGDLDVVANGVNGGAQLYRLETAAPRLAVRLSGRAPNRSGIGALVRVRDGAAPLQMQEMLCGGHYLSGSEPLLCFAAGRLTNRLAIEVRWRSGASTRLREVAPNQRVELEEPDGGPAPQPAVRATPGLPWFEDVSPLLRHEHHEELFNDFVRQPLLTRLLSQLGPGVGWVDLDEDGADELVVGAGRGGRVAVLHAGRDRNAPWLALTNTPVCPDDTAGLATWVCANGKAGLLLAESSYETGASNSPVAAEWAFDANAQLAIAPVRALPGDASSPGPLAVADFDGDGDLDLFVGGRVLPGAYPQPARSRLFRREGGQLIADAGGNALLEQAGLVSGAVWSDLEGDGYPELVLACEWGPIRLFRNDHGRLSAWDPPLAWPEPATAEARPSRLGDLTGWWNGVTAGDLDGDGRLDLIASNWGLNDFYQATAERPLRVYFGDLAGQGSTDVLEACFPRELSSEMPQRSLNALGQALPFLAGHYPTHAAFSQATMAEILALLPAKPAVAAANTLASLALLNRGTHFEVRRLPREAQLAPAFAVCVADADGDGAEDVFLSQNFFALRPEWPRLDSGRGLWLRGDGRGGLKSVPGQESGVAVYGEQRGAAVADFDRDGRVDLVVAQNGAATRLFRNRGGAPGLRVRLEGPAGNPRGVGAVVRLQFAGQPGPAREIHGGSGYWSQDSTVPVLALPRPASGIWVRWPGGQEFTYPLQGNPREVILDARGGSRPVVSGPG